MAHEINQSKYSDKRAFYECDIGSGDDELWSAEDVAIEVWAQFGKARRVFGASLNNDGKDNPWVQFVKPGHLNPECGFRIYEPGLLKRKEFAQFVVGVMGKHFRISCWRRKRGGQTIFDTEDLGMEDDFFANLKATVARMTEIARQVDTWSRAGTLKESFPKEWVGMTRLQVIKSLREQAKT